MASGDTLLIKSGTYQQAVNPSPSGTNWDNATELKAMGTTKLRFTDGQVFLGRVFNSLFWMA